MALVEDAAGNIYDDGTDYGNEGRNYPDTESTQGPGGSPVNASTNWLNNLPSWAKNLYQAATSPAGIAALGGAALGYLDRPKATGGGTTMAYPGAAQLTRKMVQGPYGPLAEYTGVGGGTPDYRPITAPTFGAPDVGGRPAAASTAGTGMSMQSKVDLYRQLAGYGLGADRIRRIAETMYGAIPDPEWSELTRLAGTTGGATGGIRTDAGARTAAPVASPAVGGGDRSGFTRDPNRIGLSVMTNWYNPKTGQTYMAPDSAWSPPSSDWVKGTPPAAAGITGTSGATGAEGTRTPTAAAAGANTRTEIAAPPALPSLIAGDTFAGGRALNERYKDLVKRELGFDLPDLSPYTGKYLAGYVGQLADPASRASLINAMRTAQAQEAAGGYYQPGDLTPVISGVGRQANPSDWWNNYYNSVFGNGNSYFIPDTSEVTYIPEEVIQAFRKPGETNEQVHSRLYHGNRFLDSYKDLEYQLRSLMNPTEADNLNNLLRENARTLTSFDVGRGSLTPDQGYAVSRLLEAKDQYDEWKRTMGQYKGDAAKLQSELETGTFYDPRSTYTPENLEQLRSDKQRELDRLKAALAAGNPSESFYSKIATAARTIDPSNYGGLSTKKLLQQGFSPGFGFDTYAFQSPVEQSVATPAPIPAPTTASTTAPEASGYTGLTNPQGIASAYNEFISSRGGDTEANRAEALQYLQNQGIAQPMINQAYDVFKQKAFARGGEARAYAGGKPLTMEDGGFVFTEEATRKLGPQGIAALGGKMISAPGNGTDDKGITGIIGRNGVTPARVSNGEAYFPPGHDTKKLYALMHSLERKA